MALIICSECLKQFSDDSNKCPNCWKPTSKMRFMECPVCGTKNREVSVFCRECGIHIDEELERQLAEKRVEEARIAEEKRLAEEARRQEEARRREKEAREQEEALRREQEAERKARTEKVMQLLEQANKQLESRKYRNAIDGYKVVLELDKSNEEANNKIKIARNGHNKRIKANIIRALMLVVITIAVIYVVNIINANKQYGINYSAGEASIQRNDYEQAQKYYAAALKYRSNDAVTKTKIEQCDGKLYELNYNKGQEYSGKAMWEEAAAAYQLALEYRPKDVKAEEGIKEARRQEAVRKQEEARIEEEKVRKQEEALKQKIKNMALIPAGEFMMGSPSGEGSDDERPQHKVSLDAYYIDKYEVTNRQYADFLNAYGKDTDDKGNKMIYECDKGVNKVDRKWQPARGYEKYPVVKVTWFGANQYAKYYGKRLPTEAEWEKACRAGSTTKYCFGDDKSKLGDYAWYDSNSGSKTHPVGQKKANVWGIYDMHGNVWEWCSDWYDENYYSSSPTNNPKGPSSGSFRVVRGGGWVGIADVCRSANRFGINPNDWSFGDGFRCAAGVVP